MCSVYLLLCLGLLSGSLASGQGLVSNLAQRFIPGWGDASGAAAQKTLVELGIRFTDASRIINITDANWQSFLGQQSFGEWLVEFTAKAEHCPSCEIIDLAFNVSPSPRSHFIFSNVRS